MSVMISLSAYNIKNTEIFIFYSYILKAFLMKDWRFFFYIYAESDIITDILSSSKAHQVPPNGQENVFQTFPKGCKIKSGKFFLALSLK